ncbi:putative aldolase class 2 protein CC_1201 [Tubulanus polymorphus]|uniref:putative aldolase class 2 protein CC_1201 n=1 Tax=Tubulanus polymorphus TaxID=672921 RepID=UPI003DA59F52
MFLVRSLARNVASRSAAAGWRCFSDQAAVSAAAINKQARLDLATAYRLLDKERLNEGVCNHLTARVPSADGKHEILLLIPYGMHWSQVTASSLIGVTRDGKVVEGDGIAELAAATIHGGVHSSRPNAHVVLHTHMPYATALTCLKDAKIEMVHQVSLRFFKGVGYDRNYTGFSDHISEGNRLAEVMGTHNDVLMMAHHGVIVTGPTIARAVDDLYYLERACMYQVLATSTGKEIQTIDDELAEKTYHMWKKDADTYANSFFSAWQKRLLKEDPSIAD